MGAYSAARRVTALWEHHESGARRLTAASWVEKWQWFMIYAEIWLVAKKGLLAPDGAIGHTLSTQRKSFLAMSIIGAHNTLLTIFGIFYRAVYTVRRLTGAAQSRAHYQLALAKAWGNVFEDYELIDAMLLLEPLIFDSIYFYTQRSLAARNYLIDR